MNETRIYLLGQPLFQRNGRIVHVPRHKSVALAAYLALHPGKHSRDELAAFFWPDQNESEAKGQFRRILSVLKKSLGEGNLTITRDWVSLRDSVWTDIREFSRTVEEALSPVKQNRLHSRELREKLEKAAELYRGTFLSGLRVTDSLPYDDWSFFHAEYFKNNMVQALRRLSELYEEEGSFRKAIDTERKLLQIEPEEEEARHRLKRLIEDRKVKGLSEEPFAQKVKPGFRLLIIPAAVVLAAALVFTGFQFARGREGKETPSIAVLPLENIGNRPEKEWICDGMLNSIISELAGVSGLRVISRTSVMRYKNGELNTMDIARALGTDYLLEGSVTSIDRRILVSAQLIDGKSDTYIWTGNYEKDLKDVLTLNRTIAREIANRVQIKLTPNEERRLFRSPSVDPETYEAYWMGKYFFENSPTPEGLEKSASYFTQAIDKDPDFAPAWAGLANYYWGATQYGLIPPKRGMLQANEAALKAISLDETLAEAYTVLGFIRFYLNWDWEASEEAFRKAIELKPSSSEAYMWYSSLLSTLGRFDEAIQSIEQAYSLNPFSLLVRANLAARYFHAGLYDSALEACSKIKEMNPDFYMAYLVEGWTRIAEGRYSEAIPLLEKAYELSGRTDRDSLAHMAYAYGMTGAEGPCREILRRLEEKGKTGVYASPFFLSHPYLGLGEKEKALKLIEKAYEEKDGNLIWNFRDPLLNGLRDDPRFKSVQKKLSL